MVLHLRLLMSNGCFMLLFSLRHKPFSSFSMNYINSFQTTDEMFDTLLTAIRAGGL